ncbi:hypothetical protein Efla_000384 [Eimeria flavescens]
MTLMLRPPSDSEAQALFQCLQGIPPSDRKGTDYEVPIVFRIELKNYSPCEWQTKASLPTAAAGGNPAASQWTRLVIFMRQKAQGQGGIGTPRPPTSRRERASAALFPSVTSVSRASASDRMAERKRRADEGSERESVWQAAALNPGAALEELKRLRSRSSFQDRYSFPNPYELPAHEEAAHRIIAAHWARTEAAATGASVLSAANKSCKDCCWGFEDLGIPPQVSLPATPKAHAGSLLSRMAGDSFSPSCLASSAFGLHSQIKAPSKMPPEGKPAFHTRQREAPFAGKEGTELFRQPHAPVLLGLERQYCQPQTPAWEPETSDFFL